MQEIGVLETNVVECPVRDLLHHLRDLGGEFLSMKNLRDLNRTYLRVRCISLTEIAFWNTDTIAGKSATSTVELRLFSVRTEADLVEVQNRMSCCPFRHAHAVLKEALQITQIIHRAADYPPYAEDF